MAIACNEAISYIHLPSKRATRREGAGELYKHGVDANLIDMWLTRKLWLGWMVAFAHYPPHYSSKDDF